MSFICLQRAIRPIIPKNLLTRIFRGHGPRVDRLFLLYRTILIQLSIYTIAQRMIRSWEIKLISLIQSLIHQLSPSQTKKLLPLMYPTTCPYSLILI